MKVYIGFKKMSNGKVKRGMAIYTKTGKMLCNIIEKFSHSSVNKFDEYLATIKWGIRKFRHELEYVYGDLEVTSADIFIDSKTVYSWFEKGTSPVLYIEEFSDILFDLSFINLDVISMNYSKELKLDFDANTDDALEEIRSYLKEFEAQSITDEEVIRDMKTDK